MGDILKLTEKIQAIDSNMRELWDLLDDENKKALGKEYYILNRFISNVRSSSREIQEHYVLTVNQYYNKHWFALQKHPKLLWLLLCMCSYNGDKFYHEWIGFGNGNNHKQSDTDQEITKKIKLLEKIYPEYNSTELHILATINTIEEITELCQQYNMFE